MLTTDRTCPSCRDERVFEQLPCADGHGSDCPDWVCVDCGTVLVLGILWSDVTAAADGRPMARRSAA